MATPRATQAAITRALEAWTGKGLTVGRLEITPDGGIIITAPVASSNEPPQTKGPKQWRNIG